MDYPAPEEGFPISPPASPEQELAVSPVGDCAFDLDYLFHQDTPPLGHKDSVLPADAPLDLDSLFALDSTFPADALADLDATLESNFSFRLDTPPDVGSIYQPNSLQTIDPSLLLHSNTAVEPSKAAELTPAFDTSLAADTLPAADSFAMRLSTSAPRPTTTAANAEYAASRSFTKYDATGNLLPKKSGRPLGSRDKIQRRPVGWRKSTYEYDANGKRAPKKRGRPLGSCDKRKRGSVGSHKDIHESVTIHARPSANGHGLLRHVETGSEPISPGLTSSVSDTSSAVSMFDTTGSVSSKRTAKSQLGSDISTSSGRELPQKRRRCNRSTDLTSSILPVKPSLKALRPNPVKQVRYQTAGPNLTLQLPHTALGLTPPEAID